MSYKTLSEISKHLLLSPSTISRVINGKTNVSTKTRERVERALEEYDYVPNVIARSLKTSTKFIGVIFPDIRNPYFTEVILGIESILKEKGYTILYLNTNNRKEEEEKRILELLSVRAEGIILLSNFCNEESKAIQIAKKNTYLASVENYIEGIDNITVDNIKGTQTALNYLYEKGHTKIGYCGNDLSYSSWQLRYQTYETFMKEKNIYSNGQHIYIGQDFTDLLDINNLPTAIFTNNDMNALKIYKWCQNNGVKIPEQLSVIGFDDISFAKILSPKLTTIAQPAYEIGQIVSRNMFERIENKTKKGTKKIFINPIIKKRESVLDLKNNIQGELINNE